ncbi:MULTISPECIES: preprotein translocase subunit SecG [unclassified Undibacterium]|jgi:preprotein translocase subunit SecG|uniref:preprotein translocase subunit SecG n=1 Tax=unclassified Undibacterium TaxID=2630295 RepID=UPI00164B1F2F|nr:MULTISPECIES: preprotein translocase subunit SecG [unclassified Undibacterium]MBC3878586.1 preprotein translocase subunit SecG [Undibacterium sp. FT79W]MBC3929141.1 preprotein translocase subunit SecG [Undibacterium sp. CY21W]MBK1890564.1 preprotein translocase subunit SecG [Undibacterium sp. 14-3-2]MBY0569659.1 preprotein translocase subunit SecG [Burkholderiaceae bacterium]
MQTFFTLVVVVQVISALAIIALVLLQHGKGADMGASFGSGASGSLFGATGSSNFLSRSTGIAAAIFFAATLALGVFGGERKPAGGVMDNLPVTKVAPAVVQTPAPASAAAASSAQPNQIPK